MDSFYYQLLIVIIFVYNFLGIEDEYIYILSLTDWWNQYKVFIFKLIFKPMYVQDRKIKVFFISRTSGCVASHMKNRIYFYTRTPTSIMVRFQSTILHSTKHFHNQVFYSRHGFSPMEFPPQEVSSGIDIAAF